ncbi:MAG: hypothetical protein J0L67_19240 [Cytophagales bacterium]|nr:hypothetical protein [Cytophagales bacterium]
MVTFFLGYMEWGADNRTFLFQAAAALLISLPSDLEGLLNPFVIIPLAGMIMLVITFFQKSPSRKLSLIGLACLAVFMVFLFFIGLISMNFKIALSTIPFLACAMLSLRLNLRKKIAGL